jgi:hypothetical protein
VRLMLAVSALAVLNLTNFSCRAGYDSRVRPRGDANIFYLILQRICRRFGVRVGVLKNLDLRPQLWLIAGQRGCAESLSTLSSRSLPSDRFQNPLLVGNHTLCSRALPFPGAHCMQRRNGFLWKRPQSQGCFGLRRSLGHG